MEIYRNEQANVDLEVPVVAIGGTFDVTAYENDALLYTFPTVGAISGGYRVVLPFHLVQYDRSFEVRWSFDYVEGSTTKTYNYVTEIDVATPIIPLSQLATILDDVTEEQRREAEAIVRNIIQSYTGQTFGKFYGVKNVAGNDSTRLAMPTPLISFDSMTDVTFDYDPTAFRITGEGWFLGQIPGAYWTIKDSPPDEILDSFNNVIVAPDSIKKNDFSFCSIYTINGVWGYESVPVKVIQAAKILINDYACQDATYRDRYLHSMKSADWRFEFNQGAFDGTGNVKADQLLEEYRLDNIAVI